MDTPLLVGDRVTRSTNSDGKMGTVVEIRHHLYIVMWDDMKRMPHNRDNLVKVPDGGAGSYTRRSRKSRRNRKVRKSRRTRR